MKQLKYLLMMALTAFVAVSCLTGQGYEPYKKSGNTGQKGLVISADKSVVYATGEDVATFKVTFDGIALSADQVTFHYESDDRPVADMNGLQFATKSSGRHEIYARYQNPQAAPASEEESEGEEQEPEFYKSNVYAISAIEKVNLSDWEDTNPENDLTLTPSTLVYQAAADKVYLVVRYNGKVVRDPEAEQDFDGEKQTVKYQILDYDTQVPVELQSEIIEQENEQGEVERFKVYYYTAQSAEVRSFFVMWKAIMTYESPITLTAVNRPIPLRPNDSQPQSYDFKHRSLLLQLTGTACPNCPYMSIAIRELMAEGSGYEDKFAFAAAHTYQTHPFNPDKDLGVYAGQGYPSCCVDFSYTFTNGGKEANKAMIKNVVDGRLEKPAKAGISASMVLDGEELVVRMSVKIAETGRYRVGAWLVEDDLYYVQSNNSAYDNEEYNLNWHEGVIRIVNSCPEGGSNFTGFNLSDIADQQAGTVYDHLFSFTLDPTWVKENCHLVLFITAQENGGYTVTNAVTTKSLTEAIEYEYN